MQLTKTFPQHANADHFHFRGVAPKIEHFFDRALGPIRKGIRDQPIKFVALVAWVAFFFGLVAKG